MLKIFYSQLLEQTIIKKKPTKIINGVCKCCFKYRNTCHKLKQIRTLEQFFILTDLTQTQY